MRVHYCGENFNANQVTWYPLSFWNWPQLVVVVLGLVAFTARSSSWLFDNLGDNPRPPEGLHPRMIEAGSRGRGLARWSASAGFALPEWSTGVT
jgi:hypothetical protein